MVEKVFGTNAGKVWRALKDKGRLNAEELRNATRLKETNVFGALGWLAREGKVKIIRHGNKHAYEIK